jgi:hypothetical protein
MENLSAANVRALSISSPNDISRVIDMAVSSRLVKSLIAFDAVFNDIDELRTLVENDVLHTLKSGGFTAFGQQTSLVTNTQSKIRTYQQENAKAAKDHHLNFITANDISQTIDMTMHDR